MINHLHQTLITRFIYPSVLRASSGFRDLGIGQQVHARIIKSGFDDDDVIQTSLLSMYGDLGCLDYACQVFDEMPVRDVVSWSSIIASCVYNGEVEEGLEMFRLMVSEGFCPDYVTMLSLLEACGCLGVQKLGRSVHGNMLRQKIEIDGPLANSLVTMYSKFGDLLSAERIFSEVKNRCTISWTAMISGYNRLGCFSKALDVFVRMLRANVKTNSVTLMSLLGSCAGLGLLKEGKSVHCYILRKFSELDECLGPALIELYAECGKLSESEKVVCLIGEKNIVSWNMLISMYARKGLFKEALVAFVRMQEQGHLPDSFSLSSSISACGNIGSLLLGVQIHGHVIKRDISNEFVPNSLIDMYSKCGFVSSAHQIFDMIPHRSVVTWNVMLCGLSRNGNSVEAFNLFYHMYLNSLKMDEITLLMAIQACSDLGHLDKGKWVHHKLISYGIVSKDVYIDTALADMYAKCGDLQAAQRIFNSMSGRSVVSWSAMIAGHGMHGESNVAISVFKQMLKSGTKPNGVTFMNLLSACSHSGSVKEGQLYFAAMRKFGIEPNSGHYACMVDLLSRAGDIDEAYKLIRSMPFPADASIWSALLNGCRIHRRLDMMRTVENDILDISTDDTGYYTLLSNIYAQEEKWDKFGQVRSVMDGTGLWKVPGYSTVVA